jgi:hypothetical protein
VKTARYFDSMRSRPDRAAIRDEWIDRVVSHAEFQRVQADGRQRRSARIPEAGSRWLRVVVLADGETVHNAFFDRGFEP